MTGLFLRLRACERLGMTPGDFERMTAGVQALYLAYDRVRRAEEARELSMLARVRFT